MSDANNNSPPSVTSSIKQLFSPPVIALVRYALTALAPLFALAGFTVLTPDQVTKTIGAIQQFGTAAAAIAALLGVIVPIAMAVFGAISATIKKQVARVKELASNPALASAEAQKALISATSEMAPKSEDAKQALIAATIALPSVQTIVTDAKTADAAPSENVVASKA